MAKNKEQKVSIDHEERTREAARRLDLGNGIEVTMGLRREDGKIDVSYYFTNKVKGLKKSTKAELGELQVEYSSAEAGDKDLLQHLSQKTR